MVDVRHMMQHAVAEHHVEGVIGEWQTKRTLPCRNSS